MGRPSDYSEELAARICERLVEESLRTICKDEDMPHRSTVLRWVAKYPEFEKLYGLALDAKVEAWADDIVQIADTPLKGEKRTTKPDGSIETVEADMIEHRKVQIESRKWFLERLKPKKYGTKVDVEHGGSVGLVVNVKRFSPDGG